MTQRTDVTNCLLSNYRTDITKRNAARTRIYNYLDKRAETLDREIMACFGEQACISMPVCVVKWRKYSPKLPMQYASEGYPFTALPKFFLRMFRRFLREDVNAQAIYWATQEWIAKRYAGLMYFCRYNSSDGSLSKIFRLERAS